MPTTEDQLDENSKRFLEGALARGSAILFTGAGFSADATNRVGVTLPLGGALRDLLWDIAFPGQPLDKASSLGEVFEVAKTTAGNQTRQLLHDQLTVVEAPDYYGAYLAIPWYKIYTLNMDNLLRLVAGRSRPVVELATVSALRPDAHHLRHGLATVHLNGMIEDYPDVTFSAPQFGERTAGSDPLYELLARDLYSHPIIYVGTVLDESPLWHHIALRGDRPAGRELRPKSFLVTPSIPVARAAMLERYNVKHVPMNAEEFCAAYVQPMLDAGVVQPRPAVVGTPPLEDVAISRAEAAPDLPDFLLGRDPVWADVTDGFAVPRTCEGEILANLNSPPSRVVVVSGTAGSGKSTILRRLALTVQAEGKRTYWLRESTPETLAQMRAAILSSDSEVLFVDRVERFGRRGVEMIKALADDKRATKVVVSISGTSFEDLQVENALADVEWSAHFVPNLDDEEIGRLIDSLERANRLGHLAGMTPDERFREFKERASRQLLVAMIEATSGKRFEEKIAAECASLPGDLGLAYAITALATTHRYALSRDLLLAALSDYSNEGLSIVDRLTRQHLILRVSEDRYVARHPVIAREAVSYFRNAGQLVEAMKRLAFALASRIQPNDRVSAERRLLTRLTNHTTVGAACDSRLQVREMYQELEPLLRKDAHFWLQRGAYEVERGDVPAAENFLAQARSLAEGDYMVETEWAYLMLRRGCEQPLDPSAPGWVDEGFEILFDVIEKRGADSPNTYVVLAHKAIQWCNAADLSTRDRLLLLEGVRGVLKEGRRWHGANKQFVSAADDVERAYLHLGVRRG